MLECGQALVQHLDQPRQVPGEEGGRVQPEAGEGLRAADSVGARGQQLELLAPAGEPVDPVRVELHDQVLAHPGPLVVDLLRTQVEGTAGTGDLDDQLGGAVEVPLRVDRLLAAQLGRDE